MLSARSFCWLFFRVPSVLSPPLRRWIRLPEIYSTLFLLSSLKVDVKTCSAGYYRSQTRNLSC